MKFKTGLITLLLLLTFCGNVKSQSGPPLPPMPGGSNNLEGGGYQTNSGGPPPLEEGEGGDSGTNSFAPAYNYTNGLWISISATNTNSISLLLHGTEEGQYYNILSTENLTNVWTTNQALIGLLDLTPATNVIPNGRNLLYFKVAAPTMDRVPAPFFDLPGGNYNSPQTVRIFNTSSSATIHYTTNGLSPTESSPTITSGNAITFTNSHYLYARAWQTGKIPSGTVGAVYSFNVANPEISLPSGIYFTNQTVEISCTTTGAVIRYTTNGSDPTDSSPIYTNALPLTNNLTLKTKAWSNGTQSGIRIAWYQVKTNVPANDNFTNAVVLSGTSGRIFGNTVGASGEEFEETSPIWSSSGSIWYKWTAPTNGIVNFDISGNTLATPQSSSVSLTVYTGVLTNLIERASNNQYNETFNPTNGADNIIFNATNSVIYFIRVDQGYATQGAIQVKWYYSPVTTPSAVPDSGTYTNNQSIILASATPNAAIHYTLDGSTPVETDPQFNPDAPVYIRTNSTLKAKAWKAGLVSSGIVTNTYTINPSATNATATLPVPIFSPTNNSLFTNSITIAVSNSVTNVVLHYTLNGDEPTLNDPLVSSGSSLVISNSATLKVKAWKTNMNTSATGVGQYAKQGVDTDLDGLLDEWEIDNGSNLLLPDQGATNPNPLAHGLNNLQVFNNPSVKTSDGYSTLGDGIPDWWKIQNGFAITTSTNAMGNNGLTLIQSYTGGYNAHNSASELPPIAFKIVHGTNNHLFLVLDAILPNVTKYRLLCAKSGSSQIIDVDVPTEKQADRYFELPDSLAAGVWTFQLQAFDTAGHKTGNSTMSFKEYSEMFSYNNYEIDDGLSSQRKEITSVEVAGYTNKEALKMAVLRERLRSAGSFKDEISIIYDYQTVFPAPPSLNYWGQGIFSPVDYSFYYSAPSVVYSNFCSQPNALDCASAYGPLGSFGITVYTYENDTNSSYIGMNAEAVNPYGLSILSFKIGYANSVYTLVPGEENDLYFAGSGWNYSVEVAQQVESPLLKATEYVFDGRYYPLQVAEYAGQDPRSLPPGYEWAPGWADVGFFDLAAVSVENPFIVGTVGTPVMLQGWCKMSVFHANGDPVSGLFRWVDQDFDRAFLCDPTTNDVPRTTEDNVGGKKRINQSLAHQTGNLSPSLNLNNDSYVSEIFPDGSLRGAYFTPTEPGKVIITTKPDEYGNYGEVVVYVIDMRVDANHDGKMDNLDLTTKERPFAFWVNNDTDHYHTVDVTDNEEDDLGPGEDVPDFQFVGTDWRAGSIPSKRDLEDYARLWLPGVSNLMAALPSGYTLDLSWYDSNKSSNPGIRIFKAAETNGGISYLTNETTAGLQINGTLSPYVGVVVPNETLLLNDPYSGAGTPGNFYVFCGTAAGKGELVLQVKRGHEVVGEASAFIELKDIKQMYERWTVGDVGSSGPTNNAIPAQDFLPAGSSAFQYSASIDTNTAYIVGVHGWNMETWEKDRYAETAFKRLYWQGYQGRFGSFRWPTYEKGPLTLEPFPTVHYDASEYNAWRSGAPLRKLLVDLNAKYAGQVRIMAHSMGNVVAGESLRTNVTLVHTYVAMQAAIGAHSYDASVTNRNMGLYGPSTPNRLAAYPTNGLPCYFDGAIGASRYVNFYNKDDFALGFWEVGQNLKPNTDASYDYHTGSNGEEDYTKGSIFETHLHLPQDTFEIFPFIIEARSLSLGAQSSVGGAFRINDQVDLRVSPFLFGDAHKGHSAQFRSTYMKRQIFWQRTLERMQLK